jgi:VanZ family protein
MRILGRQAISLACPKYAYRLYLGRLQAFCSCVEHYERWSAATPKKDERETFKTEFDRISESVRQRGILLASHFCGTLAKGIQVFALWSSRRDAHLDATYYAVLTVPQAGVDNFRHYFSRQQDAFDRVVSGNLPGSSRQRGCERCAAS